MKKFLLVLLILFLLLIGLTYWSTSVTPEEIKISEIIEPRNSDSDLPDSVKVITSNLYESNQIKRFMQGRNYRDAWAAPIKAPVFLLDSMKILEEGGGHQTHSLKLQSPSGVVFSLRSVNKDPAPLIPGIAKTLGLENIIIDGISAQHPYGALLAASLSDAAGVLNTRPKAVYLPKQNKLGKYNKNYGDRIYLLEYETEGKVNWTPYQNVLEIMDTDDLQELKMEKGKHVQIDERAFVRARLFDLLIGDWDRHAKQWGWVVQQKGQDYKAIPLAGDRDNAFFRIDGVLPTILTNKLVQPLVRPFEKDIDYMPGYVYPIDVYFLRTTPEKIFEEEARSLQQTFSDEKLEAAFKAWPKELNDLNKNEILNKLKKRRDKLVKYAKTFKKEIDKKDLLTEPLKGSEDLELPENLKKCFDCL